jgi:DNA-binding response OmpR family regulator
MSSQPRILVIDDEVKLVTLVADFLRPIGYHVLTAHNGADGLRQAREAHPNLILLDIMMPGMDGYEVCRQLRADAATRRIPILMLTAKGQTEDKVKGLRTGADDFLIKPVETAELAARIEALLRRFMHPQVYSLEQHCTLSLLCIAEHKVNIRLNGIFAANNLSQDLLHINANALAREGDNLPIHDWRFNGKRLGERIYEMTFGKHSEIFGSYRQALGGVRSDSSLHIRLESSSDLLRVPFECLLDGPFETSDYLVLRHPFARSIMSDEFIKSIPISPGIFNDLYVKGEELKVLLIASNIPPSIPHADQEIKLLNKALKVLFEQRGIQVNIDMIPTTQATYEHVRNILKRCKYHIIHYAGHGDYDPNLPEKSYLSFWGKRNRRGNLERLSAAEIQQLLQDSEARFVYLSCCRGTSTGGSAKLLDGEFLGIADSIVRAGVPAVLGFRWPVSDLGAKKLALEFYKSLAEQGQLDTALLHARRAVAAHNRDDITWLSPILIMQA